MSRQRESRRANRVQNLWEKKYLPLIESAASNERQSQSLYFCTLHQEEIGRFPAVLLTLDRYLLIQQTRCLDETSLEPLIVRLARLLWIVNPGFEVDVKKGKAFARKCMKLNCLEEAEDITDYLARMLRGLCSEPKKEAEATKAKQSDSRHWVSSIIDMFASEYGWSEQTILDLPIPRLVIYLDRIRERKTGQLIASGGSEGDKLRQAFMNEINEIE